MQHGNRSREFMEMRTICSLTSGVSRWMIHSMSVHPEYHGEIDIMLGMISEVCDAWSLCERLISSVNILMVYHDDLDAWEIWMPGRNNGRSVVLCQMTDIQGLHPKRLQENGT